MSTHLQDYTHLLQFPYSDRIVLSFIGGSGMHGAKLDGHDDTDWYGIFIEPPEKALGTDSYEHFVHTTGGEPGGNRPTDVDVTLYSLNKWARLACKGNPSVLSFLFAKPEFSHYVWARLALKPEIFLAKSHLNAFLGYANAQLKRLLGQQGQKNVHRTFLEEQHGFDTKYALHITRLLYEAKELMETGRLTFPRPERDLLIDIRKGKYKLYELEQMNNQLEVEVLEASNKSKLPPVVDRKAVSKVISETYLEHWAGRRA